MLSVTPAGLQVSIVASGYRRVAIPLTNFLEMVAHSKSMRQLTKAVDDYEVLPDAEPKAMAAGAGK